MRLKGIVREIIPGVQAFAQPGAGYRHHRLCVRQSRFAPSILKYRRVEQVNKTFEAVIHTRLTHPPCHPHISLQIMRTATSEPTRTPWRWRHCTHIPNPCLRPPWLPRSQLTSVRPSQTLKSHRPPTNATFVTGICHVSKTGDHAHAGR